jgi:hypothetical protein
MAILWKTASGQHLLLKEMSTEHITNTILMLIRKIYNITKKRPSWDIRDLRVNDYTCLVWIQAFQRELRDRHAQDINMMNWDTDNMGDDDDIRDEH